MPTVVRRRHRGAKTHPDTYEPRCYEREDEPRAGLGSESLKLLLGPMGGDSLVDVIHGVDPWGRE